ncbi:inorganic diphosphatase [Candidatus Riesia pediculischaeffi]|uniref:Inorganic pyrophosphatase n=1 Tax=Candidatus Riesia pediculischaeffi TaxID=428411 RepID=A0A1V0HKH2_9ENTR|nr:inorganic diphosphatase [Candidatus Riesia pediculischaeffi]ARC53325.1 inorganic pyrophosphatase [Candidatus Riesia pediculischaeffi]
MNNLLNIPSGKNLPYDFFSIIEIPEGSKVVKYEIDKKFGSIYVDRFIPSLISYPCNYGYINQTLGKDGDPIDTLVITPCPILSGSVVRCRPIGTLNMRDESGEDVKIISVPHRSLTRDYDHIKDINDLSKGMQRKIVYFFEHYKDLEENKWTSVEGLGDLDCAYDEIIKSALK